MTGLGRSDRGSSAAEPAKADRKLWRLIVLAGVLLVAGVGVNAGLLAWKAGFFARPVPDRPVPDMPATDPAGRPATFSDYRGRWLIVYFGYTHCPDVCPQGLTDLSKAVRELGADARKVQGLFVSVDPARDTNRVIGAYVRYFRGGLAGWRVEPADLPAFTRAFGATYRYGTGAASGTVEHPTVFYVLDPRGVLAKEPVYPPISADDLRERLKGGT